MRFKKETVILRFDFVLAALLFGIGGRVCATLGRGHVGEELVVEEAKQRRASRRSGRLGRVERVQLTSELYFVQALGAPVALELVDELELDRVATQVAFHEVAVHVLFELPPVAVRVHVRFGLGQEAARDVRERVEFVRAEESASRA